MPVNTHFGGDELRHLINNSDAELLVVHRRQWKQVESVIYECPRIKSVVSIGFAEPARTAFEALVAEGTEFDYHPDIGAKGLAIIMHTSGTTGWAKGAVMGHGDLLFNNRLAIYAHSLRHEDVHLLVVPVFHATASYSLIPTSAL